MEAPEHSTSDLSPPIDRRFKVSGSVQGKQWAGADLRIRESGKYEVRVPTGASAVRIFTGQAWLNADEDQPFEIGYSFQLASVKDDVSGLRVRYNQVGRLRVVAKYKARKNFPSPKFELTYKRNGTPELRVGSAEAFEKQKMYLARNHSVSRWGSTTCSATASPN